MKNQFYELERPQKVCLIFYILYLKKKIFQFKKNKKTKHIP